MGNAENSELRVGERIKVLRQTRELSVAALADKVQVTPAQLEAIEADQNPPSIATLLRIARVLGVGLSHFFQEPGADRRYEVVRREDRAPATREHLPHAGRHGYTYEALTHNPKWRHMQPLLVEFDVGEGLVDAVDAADNVSHEGEEFLFVLRGELDFRADDQVIRLREGDSLYFDSSMPHGFVARGEQPAQALAVIYADAEAD